MRIVRISIQGFRTLKNVVLDELSNVVVIVGSNGVGKSNLLEALVFFFNYIDAPGQQALGSQDKNLWFERSDKHAIKFEVDIQLNRHEVTIQGVDKQIVDTLFGSKDEITIRLRRELAGPANATAYSALGVEPAPIFGEEDAQLKAFSTLLPLIAKQLKSQFLHVPSNRDVTWVASNFARRAPIVDQTILNALRSLSQSLDSDAQRIQFEETAQKVMDELQDVRLIQNELTLREKRSTKSFPFASVGSGQQQALALVFTLLRDEGTVYAMEEPEMHLHARLVRNLFRLLRDLSGNKQFILTTHSTVLVDTVDIASVWVASKPRNETMFTRLQGKEQLKLLLQELGHRPSDLFLANGVVFVEGRSDWLVYEGWARKLGLQFPDSGFAFIPTYGKDRGKYYLEVWIDAAKGTGLPLFFILDKGAEKSCRKFFKDGLLTTDRNLFFLQKGSIEEYYPVELIKEGIESVANGVQCDQGKLDKTTSRLAFIEETIASKFGQPAAAYKAELAQWMGEHVAAEQIDNEVRTILLRIDSASKS